MRRHHPHRLSGLLVGLLMIVVGALALGRHGFSALGGYTVAVTNSSNTAASRSVPCRNAATATGTAYLIYPFGEQTGATTAADVSGNNRDGTYSSSGITFGATGPCTTDGGRAITLDGTNGAVVSPPFVLGLLAFSEAIWFKTTTGGGLLVGVGSSATGASTTHDRALYLSDSGAVNLEVQPLVGPAVISSPSTYKDGAWHLAVGTFSATTGLRLYVDGTLVASNAGVTTALALAATSYWRIGYDSLTGVGTTAPTNPHFTGSLAYASTYTSALTAAQVAALYAARS